MSASKTPRPGLGGVASRDELGVEPICRGPWRNIDEVELATLEWVHWFNTTRLHSALGDVPPDEFEAAFYAAQQADPAGVGIR